MTETTSTTSTDIVLLDGGVGQELYRRSTIPAAPLWSVQVMMDEPHLVEAVHLDFIEAGARIITVNTYTATPHRLIREGVAEKFEALHDAARSPQPNPPARRSGEPVRIAGCLPPLVGSYRADLTPPEDECLANYRRIVAVQAERVDLFLCETMLSAAEARAATSGCGRERQAGLDRAFGGRRRRHPAALRRRGLPRGAQAARGGGRGRRCSSTARAPRR